MMAAMMLPSVAPMALVFARISRDRRGRGEGFVRMWVFLAGYFTAWTLYGLGAYGIYRVVRSADPAFLAWDAQGPLTAGGAIALAGVYELTPLKRACLRHCRSPIHFVLHSWRQGWLGALRMGFEHGVVCVGCCVALMVALFAVGVMSIFWMAVVAAIIFAEKVLPLRRLDRAAAAVLVGLGVWIAAAPSSLGVLHDPGAPAMEMGGSDSEPPAMDAPDMSPAPASSEDVTATR